MIAGRSVLVTGGLGFIGSSISESFLASGADVTIVDNCSSNVTEPDEVAIRGGRLTFIRADVVDYLQGAGRHREFDTVVHAACYVGAAGVLPYLGKIVRDAVAASAEVVDLCIRCNADLVFISSSEVYGRSGVLSESMDLRVPAYMNARIEYGLAKLACEAMIVNSANRGLRAVSLRPFNVVGPRQSRAGGFVLPTFVQQALANKPLTIFSNGRQKRAFLAIDDFVSAVRSLLDSRIVSADQRYNVGNPANSVSILELAEIVSSQSTSPCDLVFVDGQDVYGPNYFEAESIDKLCNVDKLCSTGWTPRESLTDIVAKTFGHFTRRRDVRECDVRA